MSWERDKIPPVRDPELDAAKRARKVCDIRADIGEAKRQKFLAAIQLGLGVRDACRDADWGSDQIYRYHRKNYPRWAAEVDYWKAEVRRAKAAGEVPAEMPPLPFAEFTQTWFPDRRPHEPHQLQIANVLDDLRPREVCLFLLWPAAGKSATLEDYICRKLALDNTHRFNVVSEAQDLSKRIVGTCKRRFTDHSLYGPFIHMYGPFYDKGQERENRPWASDQIMLSSNPGKDRDCNLVARSWTSAVYGARIDTLVLDDLQSQNNMNSSQEIFDRIRGTFFSRDSRDNELRTLIIGTRIGPGDFYERMMDAGIVTKLIVIPAIDAEGKITAPAWWDRQVFHNRGPCCTGFRIETCPNDGSKLTPLEYAQLIRFQQGEDNWWASYMQAPRASGLSTFGQYLENDSICFDRDRTYGPLIPA